MRTMTDQTKEDGQDAPRPQIEIESPAEGELGYFLRFLMDQREGEVVAELSEKLRDLTEAVEMHFDRFRGKSEAELSVKIKLGINRGQYGIKVEYTAKPPKAPPAETAMFLGAGGYLTKNNPRQLAMPFNAKGGSNGH